MPALLDSLMVHEPASGVALRVQKEAGEKPYRYICMSDWLAEIDRTVGFDPNEANYTVTPLISGQAGILVVVAVTDDDLNDPGVTGKPGTMLVIGEYSGNAGNKYQRYSILCPLTDGQVRELVIENWVLPKQV